MTPTPKKLTYEQVRNRLEAVCAQSEQSTAYARKKALLWGLTTEEIEQLIAHLCEEKYIQDTRYCTAYVRDKLRYNHWGRIKIFQMLRLQGLDDSDIRVGMDAIDEDEYLGILAQVIRSKSGAFTPPYDAATRAKIIRHASSKGFELHAILRTMDNEDFTD